METTTSLAPSATPVRPLAALEKELGPEDLRRALGAMAIALDPQGNGAPVHWSNPQTGSKGAFVQAGKPYPSDAVVCRAYGAEGIRITIGSPEMNDSFLRALRTIEPVSSVG